MINWHIVHLRLQWAQVIPSALATAVAEQWIPLISSAVAE